MEDYRFHFEYGEVDLSVVKLNEFHQVFLEPGVPGRYLDGRYRLGIHESWIEIESEGMG